MMAQKHHRIFDSAIYNLPILIVDDLAFNRQILTSLLKGYNFTNITEARDGLEALEKIKANKPAIVLLDIIMPNMDGFEVCAWIRSQEAFQDIPILVQTSLEDPEDRNAAFQIGANDVIQKPINPEELYNRTCIQLEKAYLLQQLKAYQDRLKDELDEARQLQLTLFPSRQSVIHHQRAHSVTIASIYKPSSELTGDIWGLLPDMSGNFGVFIADFSGHGVSAAVNTFRLFTYMEMDNGFGTSKNLLETLNNKLVRVLPVGKYATFLHGIFKDDSFVYSCAGACQPLVLLPNGEVLAGNNAGTPLGIQIYETYELQSLPFPVGSILLLFSDALIDIMGGDTQDTTGIGAVMAAYPTPKDMITALVQVTMEAEGDHLHDDLTMVAVRRDG